MKEWKRSTRTSILCVLLILAIGVPALAQVSPAEITKPSLKRAEQAHFQQLIDLNRAISQLQFPFPVVLSRYPGLDPKRQAGSDKRGLEFTEFQGRVLLKISANYNAAFNAQALTQNQRASRVLDEVVVPILNLLPKYFSPSADFDGVGVEVSYHVRTDKPSYAYEGAEVLTAVFNKEDAFRFAGASESSDRQGILDNSEIFVNGKRFGLMLGQRDALPMDEAEETKPARKPHPRPAAAPIPSTPGAQSPGTAQEYPSPESPSTPEAPPKPAGPDTRAMLMGNAPAAPATQADADALQAKLQSQLQALDAEGRAHDNFVDYAPPSFAIFRNQIYLQLTLRNPNVFDPNTSSIYKRAARSFDLFLGPRLKGLLAKTPDDPSIAGLDITVLTEFSGKTTTSSEAIEFACPIEPLHRFAEADITNQDLINQSVVLVNGVRIALDLQKVE
jgi:hypothetical protein